MGAIHIHLHSNQTKTHDRKVKDIDYQVGSEKDQYSGKFRAVIRQNNKIKWLSQNLFDSPGLAENEAKRQISNLKTKDAVRLVPGKKYRLKNNKGIVTYIGPDPIGRHGDIKVKNSSGFTTSLHEDDIESEYTRDDSSDVERLRDRVRALERRAQLYNSAGGLPKSHPLKVELSQAREELKKAQTTAKRTTKWI